LPFTATQGALRGKRESQNKLKALKAAVHFCTFARFISGRKPREAQARIASDSPRRNTFAGKIAFVVNDDLV
jgi:hypothetical protein